jgi:prepilin signal peptidase PulO-like enzyme (type II secretory pathway)
MIGLMILIGWIIGWAIGRAADAVPRLAGKPTRPTDSRPAVWRLLRGGAWREYRLGLLAELGSAVFFGILHLRYGQTTPTLILGAAYTFLLLVTLIDLRYQLVLNIMVYPALLVVLAAYVLMLPVALPLALVGAGFALATFMLTAWLMPGGVGGGDIKLAALIGFTLGFPQLIWALLIGTGSGALAAIWLLLRGRKAPIAYAPYLCLGALIALLYNPFTR